MPAWLATFLGDWLSKQVGRLVSFLIKKGKSFWAGKTHRDNVDKYIDAINMITAKAKAEATETGRVSNATELELKQMLERRNRDIEFDDAWMQNYPWN
jgi:hypothetical protein